MSTTVCDWSVDGSKLVVGADSGSFALYTSSSKDM